MLEIFAPSTGRAAGRWLAFSRNMPNSSGRSLIGVTTTFGPGDGPLLDLDLLAAGAAGAAAGAAGGLVTPSAFSFSVTESLIASTRLLNCSCVIPGGVAVGV